ncbi:N-acetylmuramoyl-L-alanine amidase [Streptomyces sp. NPDC049040]|uniref:peptidoglycan recognition protein family protein n=1 Tax=Streptomyces sp. NPDC049040 TaxID=3365593 RepID=UPI003715A34D
MATPMTADELVAALKAEGVTLAERSGWRTHNRAGHGSWGPVNGVMIHHTGGTAPSDAAIVWNGRSDLPGPLAHGYLAKSGTVTMTGNGRTNHAGGGDPAVLAVVADES